MQDYMKVWVGEREVGSVGTDGTILDADGKMVGHIYLYTGEVSLGNAVAGEMVVGSVSHEGDIYDNSGKVGDVARSGNIWDAKGSKIGWVAPLQYWKSAISLYESYDAPVLLAGGAALLLVLRRNAAHPYQMYQHTIPLSSHIYSTQPIL
ncbi:MAG TPA: hypothetical protein VJ183_15735 [Chloroflexia bacterium]|nr:hypothetical protein [Chloroflexia bacterium]